MSHKSGISDLRSEISDPRRPRRRWLILGPGIAIAIILALQVMISQRQQASGPPMIERQVIGARNSQAQGIAREVSYIIARASQLRLSTEQLGKLRRLEAQWKLKSAPLAADLDRAAKDFQRFMDRAQGKASLPEIQTQGAPVSELSRQLSSLRRTYWQKALQVLNPKQRAAL